MDNNTCSTTLNSNSSFELDFYRLDHHAYMVCAAYLTTISVYSALGNTLVIVVLTCSKNVKLKGKHYQNCLLLNLAVSDLILACADPVVIASHIKENWLFSESICELYAFTVFSLSEVSLGTLVALAIYRYIIICQPGKKILLTKRFTIKILIGIWIYGLTGPLFPVLGWSSYTIEPFLTSCSVDWTNTALEFVLYDFYIIIFYFILQLVVLLYCYIKIGKKYMRYFRSGPDETQPQRKVFMYKQFIIEQRTTMMCLFMVLGYVVAWTPYPVVSLTNLLVKLPPLSIIIPTMAAKTAPAINFTLYAVLNKNFRKNLVGMIKRCSGAVAPDTTNHSK